jgi:hypothetical protein
VFADHRKARRSADLGNHLLGHFENVNLRIAPTQYRGFRFRTVLTGLSLLLTMAVGALADTSGPIHDWTVHIGDGDYGVTSWAPGCWNVYWGSRIEPSASVGVQYAVVVLLMLLLGIIACPSEVMLLRLAARLRWPSPPDSVDGGISTRFQVGRKRPGATNPNRWTA